MLITTPQLLHWSIALRQQDNPLWQKGVGDRDLAGRRMRAVRRWIQLHCLINSSREVGDRDRGVAGNGINYRKKVKHIHQSILLGVRGRDPEGRGKTTWGKTTSNGVTINTTLNPVPQPWQADKTSDFSIECHEYTEGSWVWLDSSTWRWWFIHLHVSMRTHWGNMN